MVRILVADDDVDLLDMVCLMIMANGLNPTCVDSGEAALEALRTQQYSLVLMDVFLGDHDGRQLSRKLKNSPEYKNIPILLYSAGQIEPSTIQEAQADGFLQKPFDMKELLSRIQSLTAN